MNQISVDITKKVIMVDIPKRGPRGRSGNTSKGITIQLPNSQEDIAFMTAAENMTIASVQAVVKGNNPEVVFNIVKSQRRSDIGTSLFSSDQVCNDQTGLTTYIPQDSNISTGNIIRLQIVSLTGSIEEFHLSIHFSGQ